MNIDLIEAIDNAKVDSEIAVAESMIMCYDKQLLLMEYESPVDIFQEGKIMDDVKEQGKGQTKVQKVLSFIPRLLKAIFKALTGKLSKVGDSAKKVAKASKKVPVEINKKIANAFNKGDKKGLSSALKTILITTASLGFGILLAKFARKYAEKISYLKMRWKHLKENPQNARDDKTDKLIMKIMPVLTKLENVGKNNEKLDNKAAKDLIEDVNDIVEIISDEKDAPKIDAEYKETLTETAVLFTNLQKDCKANDDTKNDEKPTQTEEKKPESDNTKKDEKPAEQKADTQEASNDKDPEDVDAFVNRVLTDDVKGLIDSGLFKIDLDASYAYSISFRMCLPHSFILELSGYVHTITEVSEMKKLFDDLKNLVNTNNPSILKNIAKRIHLDLNSCDVSVNKQTDDVKRVIDKYHTISPEELSKKFSYIEDEKDREKLINDYEIIVKGLQKLSTKYLLIVNNVIDEFYKYFSNIDKDGVSSYPGSRTMSIDSIDVLKQAEMVDSSIKGAMSKS